MSVTLLENGYLGKKFLRDKTSSRIIDAMSTVKVATKVLQLQPIRKHEDALKLVISSFWLNLFNFFENDQVIETPIAKNQGFEVRHAASEDTSSKKVYGRNYANRKQAKREPLMDIRSQNKLKLSLGSATKVRVIFKKDLITVLPVFALERMAKPEALDIALTKDDGLYYGIIAATKLIKENLFTEFTIESDSDFTNSTEFTLLSIQVARLGYQVEVIDGNVVGRLGKKQITKRHHVDVSNFNASPKPIYFNKLNPLSTTGICTSGVDVCAAEDDGFSTLNVLDYRPIEKRDLKSNQDRSETGAICAAYNAKSINTVFNECIYGIDTQLMRNLMRPSNFASISLQCSEYTTVKNKADKHLAIDELTTTIDMIFPVLDIIEQNNFATLLTENVPNFATSVEAKLYIRRLYELGYKVEHTILKAQDYNGYTKRARSYIFASKLPAIFSWPEKEQRTVNIWHDIVMPNIEDFRCVSQTGGIKTMLEGQKLSASCADVSTLSKSEQTKVRKYQSRNIINCSSHIAGTVLRSQSKQVAETLYAKIGDDYFMPNNTVLKAIMGIKESFDISVFTQESGAELVGQSIEVPMHHKISQSIKNHIRAYVSSLKNVTAFC